MICSVKPRLNVAEYKMNNGDEKEVKPEKVSKAESSNGELTQNQKYKQCPRLWRYSINEDKTKCFVGDIIIRIYVKKHWVSTD